MLIYIEKIPSIRLFRKSKADISVGQKMFYQKQKIEKSGLSR